MLVAVVDIAGAPLPAAARLLVWLVAAFPVVVVAPPIGVASAPGAVAPAVANAPLVDADGLAPADAAGYLRMATVAGWAPLVIVAVSFV